MMDLGRGVGKGLFSTLKTEKSKSLYCQQWLPLPFGKSIQQVQNKGIINWVNIQVSDIECYFPNSSERETEAEWIWPYLYPVTAFLYIYHQYNFWSLEAWYSIMRIMCQQYLFPHKVMKHSGYEYRVHVWVLARMWATQPLSCSSESKKYHLF